MGREGRSDHCIQCMGGGQRKGEKVKDCVKLTLNSYRVLLVCLFVCFVNSLLPLFLL